MAALVVAVVLACCPLLGPIAAMILGTVAVSRVLRSPTPRRGIRLAWAALAIGAVSLLVQGIALQNWQEHAIAEMDGMALTTVRDALEGTESAEARWVSAASGGPTPEQRRALAAGLKARLGPLRGVSVTTRSSDALFKVTVTFIAEFERGTAFGSADFITGTLQSMTPELIAQRIELDVSGQRVMLPPEPSATEPAKDPPATDQTPAP